MSDVRKDLLIKEKREIWYKAKDLRKKLEDEKRLLSEEEKTLYKSWVDRMHELQDNIETLQSMEDMAAENRGNVYDNKGIIIGDKEEQTDKYNRAVRNWLRLGTEGLSDEERQMVKPGFNDKGGARGPSIELRAPGAMAGTSYTMATDVMAAVAVAKKFFGNFLPAFDEFTTAKGNPITWPKLDDTSYTGALEIAGTDTFTSSDAVTLTSSTLNNYIYSSQGVAIANDAMEDADFPIDRILGEALGTRLWRKIALDATTGTGTSMISGIVGKAVGAPIGHGAGACAITRARLLQLMGSVDYGYHQMPGCGYMMHSSQMYELAGVSTASTDGRPLWQPSMREGVPDKIEGFPYWINNNLSANTVYPHMGAACVRLQSARHILFGDFKQYKLRYVGPAILVRLNELYAAQLQTGFVMLQRVDGKLLMPNTTTYAPVKYLRKYQT
jgi:HK97 family phage major capsid protein